MNMDVDPRMVQALRDNGLIAPAAEIGSYGKIVHTYDEHGLPAPLSDEALTFMEKWAPPPSYAEREQEELIERIRARSAVDRDYDALVRVLTGDVR